MSVRIRGDEIDVPTPIGLPALAKLAFDGNDLCGSRVQERAREAARPGADLDDRDAAKIAGSACDLGREIQIEQKMLAKALVRGEFMSGDDLAQRRQPRQRPFSHRASFCVRA